MDEALWGIAGIISGVIVAVIFYIIGCHQGKKQNRELNVRINDLETQNNEQKEMLEKSYQAIGTLKSELKEIRFAKTESRIIPKKESALEKTIKDLALYGIKEWGKKAINEWLYPDEDYEDDYEED